MIFLGEGNMKIQAQGKKKPLEDFLELGLIKAPAFKPCAPTEE